MGFVLMLIVLVVGCLVLGIVLRGLFEIVSRVGGFVIGVIGDLLRVAGAVVVSTVLVLPTVLSVLLGRWSAAAHYGRAIQSEGRTMAAAVYRVLIGHPARLLFLDNLVEGLETRVPRVFAEAPGADRPARGTGGKGGKREQFEGYTIIGSLPGGGSGGKLYIAEPTPEKAASLARTGHAHISRVVIKTFSLVDGSSLPQIVRENRSIPAARRLGLILEHELTEDRFFYVMRYVPGESLGLITQRMHAESSSGGLDNKHLRAGLGYIEDLLTTLREYHAGGLWHKDVKPDNIIIAAADGRAHLVDFGLITALGSTMTLTTHGTEYFRDPELVRLALKGVKVHEVDGARFDVYAAGAVLYSIVENSFPAHGGLSQISRKCPEAVRWIVRRAMTDYDKRYASAAAMLADVRFVLAAADPQTVKPMELPSVRGGEAGSDLEHEAMHAAVSGSRVDPVSVRRGASAAPRFGHDAVSKPRLRVTNWWTGKYEVAGAGAAVGRLAAGSPVGGAVGGGAGAGTAQEQIRRARAEEARRRAHERMAARHGQRANSAAMHGPGVNFGVGVAVLLFMMLMVAGAVFMLLGQRARSIGVVSADDRYQGSMVDRISPLPAGTDARLAVLRDPIAYEPEHDGEVEGLLGELREAGFVFSSPNENEAEQTDAEARLRARIGLAAHGTPDARAAILWWLEKHPEYAGVVWIGRDHHNELAFWFIDRPGTSSVVTQTASKLLQGAEVSR